VVVAAVLVLVVGMIEQVVLVVLVGAQQEMELVV
jgi:hypothetical protein